MKILPDILHGFFLGLLITFAYQYAGIFALCVGVLALVSHFLVLCVVYTQGYDEGQNS
jgi:hypothetical protein